MARSSHSFGAQHEIKGSTKKEAQGGKRSSQPVVGVTVGIVRFCVE